MLEISGETLVRRECWMIRCWWAGSWYYLTWIPPHSHSRQSEVASNICYDNLQWIFITNVANIATIQRNISELCKQNKFISLLNQAKLWITFFFPPFKPFYFDLIWNPLGWESYNLWGTIKTLIKSNRRGGEYLFLGVLLTSARKLCCKYPVVRKTIQDPSFDWNCSLLCIRILNTFCKLSQTWDRKLRKTFILWLELKHFPKEIMLLTVYITLYESQACNLILSWCELLKLSKHERFRYFKQDAQRLW